MDFKGMLEDIISFLPVSRQILLFSATFPISVKEFKVRYSLLVILSLYLCLGERAMDIHALNRNPLGKEKMHLKLPKMLNF